MKKIIRILLVVIACIIPTSVYASEIDKDLHPGYSKEKREKRAQEINDYFIKLEELKIQLEKSALELESSEINTLEALSAYENIQQQLNYYENNSLEIVGLKKLETEESSLLQPLSTKADVAVTAPTVFIRNHGNTWQVVVGIGLK